ncbi:MAG: DinB family protein [Acidobacteria bacterium]|nr:DinB family protein [Acidobacteriota bacterium]
MHPSLARLEYVLSNAIEGMSGDDFARHIRGKWSSSEILEHLNLTLTGTIRNLERSLVSGEAHSSQDRRAKRWPRRVVIWLGYFPKRHKAPERVLPRGAPIEGLRREIFDNIARMDELLARCEARFGPGKTVARHPILGPLTAREWRRFHLVHGRHHACQIVRLKNLSPE